MEVKLTIKRVPTVLSNYQEEGGGGCGRNCLGDCCLPASKLPLYAFKANPKKPAEEDGLPTEFFLNSLLLAQWEDRVARGLFRYDVTACETKVGQEEVLFRFENGGGDDSYFLDNAPSTESDHAPNVVAINVSPIEYGHVLLIPRVLDRLPQRIDHESFLLALHMAAEAASPYFRLGYNSLGAFATINHLHFQAYYLSVPFPVEKAPTKKIPLAKSVLRSGVKVSKLINFPVRGLVFERGNTLKDLADVVTNACIWLQDNNVPFNVLISDSGRRIFLFPQCYAEKQALGEVSQDLLDTQVNPAVWEISGHIVLKRRTDFEEASEDSAWRLLAEVSLSEERFEEVKACIFQAAGLTESDQEEETNEESPCASSSSVPVVSSHIPEGCLVLQ
ncbi:unnamed protein product [Alopecurus aequalis]